MAVVDQEPYMLAEARRRPRRRVLSIPVRLGDELIDAAREVVNAWRRPHRSYEALAAAITKLEELVGVPE